MSQTGNLAILTEKPLTTGLQLRTPLEGNSDRHQPEAYTAKLPLYN
jgi:hypothetical protein